MDDLEQTIADLIKREHAAANDFAFCMVEVSRAHQMARYK